MESYQLFTDKALPKSLSADDRFWRKAAVAFSGTNRRPRYAAGWRMQHICNMRIPSY
jgi:hypothetical protein